MRHSGIVLTLWLISLPLAVGAQNPQGQFPQQDVQIGHFIMTKPAGWRRVDLERGTFLVAPPSSPNVIGYVLPKSYPMRGNLQATFNHLWGNHSGKYELLQVGQGISGKLPSGFAYQSISAKAKDSDGRECEMLYMVIQQETFAETLVATTNDFDPQAYAEYQRGLKVITNSIRFSSAAAPLPSQVSGPAEPPSAPGAMPGAPPATGGTPTPAGMSINGSQLNGIFRAASDNTDPLDISDPANKSPNFRYLTFFPDGKVKEGLPLYGLAGYSNASDSVHGFNGNASSSGRLAYVWGFYAFSGDQGQIQFVKNAGGGRMVDHAWMVQRLPDRLEIQGVQYLPLDPCDRMRVEGTFKPFGDPKEKGIAFTRDGEFVDEGILNYGPIAAGYYGRSGGVAIGYEAPNGGRGMYQITGYTLALQYAGGSAKALFFVEPGASRDEARIIYINNIKFQRVK